MGIILTNNVKIRKRLFRAYIIWIVGNDWIHSLDGHKNVNCKHMFTSNTMCNLNVNMLIVYLLLLFVMMFLYCSATSVLISWNSLRFEQFAVCALYVLKFDLNHFFWQFRPLTCFLFVGFHFNDVSMTFQVHPLRFAIDLNKNSKNTHTHTIDWFSNIFIQIFIFFRKLELSVVLRMCLF